MTKGTIELMTTGTSGTVLLSELFNAGSSVRGGRGQRHKTARKQSSNQKVWRDGFGGFSQTGSWLRPDDRAHFIPAPRSSLAAAVLYLAKLRSVPRISRTAPLPGLLAGEARGPRAFGARRALQADQARRAQSGGRRIPAALGRQFGDARHLRAPMASWASPASTAARKSPFLL